MTWGKLGKACPPCGDRTYRAQHTPWTPREYIIPPSTNFVCTASPGTKVPSWLLVICDWLVPKLAALPRILGNLLTLNKPDLWNIYLICEKTFLTCSSYSSRLTLYLSWWNRLHSSDIQSQHPNHPLCLVNYHLLPLIEIILCVLLPMTRGSIPRLSEWYINLLIPVDIITRGTLPSECAKQPRVKIYPTGRWKPLPAAIPWGTYHAILAISLKLNVPAILKFPDPLPTPAVCIISAIINSKYNKSMTHK